MKVLLIYPNTKQTATEPSLGLMYVASALKDAGHELQIIEGSFSDVQNQIQRSRKLPDFIGIICMSSMFHEIIKMRDFFHELNVPLIFGGPHATILPESLLIKDSQFRDFVVVGEGEKTIVKIVGGQISPGIVHGERVENLDSLSFPAMDLISSRYLSHGRASILSSRGCPFNCSFCQPTLRKLFGQKVRRRSVENVVAEMKECHARFRVHQFQFWDDTFTADPRWVYDFCDQIQGLGFSFDILTRVDMLNFDILKRMKRAGLHIISLGLESGSQLILDSYSKGTTIEQNRAAMRMCKELKIRVHGLFMLGSLEETSESIRATKQFIKENKFDVIFVAITTPLPCTRLYDQAVAEKRMLIPWEEIDILGSCFTSVRPRDEKAVSAMRLKYVSNREVLDAKYNILRNYYLHRALNPLFVLGFIRRTSLFYIVKIAQNIIGGL